MQAVTMPKQNPLRTGGEKPSRTCVGCHARIDAAERDGTVRFVCDPTEGRVVVDLAGGSFGRGAHVHATRACLVKACSGGGFSKAFRCQVKADAGELAGEIQRAATRRIEGLLVGARRAGHLAFGEEAKGHGAGETPLFILATDAGPSASGGPLREAIAEGRVLPFGTKESLGHLFSRELVAVVAVRHESVAREIRKTSSLTESVGGTLGATR
jgi:predicted RNA-binding protein YlxR (DUF448 family)